MKVLVAVFKQEFPKSSFSKLTGSFV